MIIASKVIFPVQRKKYALKKPKEEILKEIEIKERMKRIALQTSRGKKSLKELKDCEFIIYTDGGYNTEYNIGSWSYLIKLRRNKVRFKIKKETGIIESDKPQLPIFMEINAVIMAINYLMKRSGDYPLERIKRITVMSDSRQVVNSNKLYEQYRENGWFYLRKNQAMTEDLKEAWETLHTLNMEYNIHYLWVKGHSGILGNERCDQACSTRIVQTIKMEELNQWDSQWDEDEIEEA
jgi:ribonuclease HI